MMPLNENLAVAVDTEREPEERIEAIQKHGDQEPEKKTRKPQMLIPGRKGKKRRRRTVNAVKI